MERLGRLAALLELLTECATLGSLDAILETAPSRLRWILEFDRLTVAIGDERHTLTRAHPHITQVAPAALPPPHEALLRRAITEAVPCWDKAGLAHPLEIGERAIGAVCVTDAKARYGDAEIRIVHHLARFLGGAIARIEQSQALRDRTLALERAQAANEAKDEFFAVLGHELRNPLAAILSAAHVLREHSDPEVAADGEIVERHGRHLELLVDDLLEVSRLSSGEVALERRPTSVARVIESAAQMLASRLEGRAQRLDVAVPTPPPYVDGDEVRLTQVVVNLLSNASRYSDRGSRVAVEVRADDEAVVIEVADEGEGIAPELLPRVFERFVRGPNARDADRSGLGLGLGIARTIVELHGGEIEAEGEGRGSVFRVRLPRVAAPERAPASEHREEAGGSKQVLVVDDNVDAADMLARVLAKAGYGVEVAYDADAALTAYDRRAPDVCLLDIGLPGKDGLQLAQEIRARETGSRRCTLVALTGYGRDRDRERTSAAGFDAHLVKPVDLPSLKRLLARDPPSSR